MVGRGRARPHGNAICKKFRHCWAASSACGMSRRPRSAGACSTSAPSAVCSSTATGSTPTDPAATDGACCRSPRWSGSVADRAGCRCGSGARTAARSDCRAMLVHSHGSSRRRVAELAWSNSCASCSLCFWVGRLRATRCWYVHSSVSACHVASTLLWWQAISVTRTGDALLTRQQLSQT